MQLSADDHKRLMSVVAKVTPKDEANVRERFLTTFNGAVARGANSQLVDGLKSLWAMLSDKDYVVSWKTKAIIVAALGYFIDPVDMIPDGAVGVGWVDDALVVAWALHNLEQELADYRAARGIGAA